MRVSIIIPAYDEEARIKETLGAYLSYFSAMQHDIDFIIVVEGHDKTLEIVKEFQKTNSNVKYSYSAARLGKGGAIICGFKMATGDLIGFVDADASTAPEAFDSLIKTIGDYDGIIASRKVRGAKQIKREPILQRFGSRGFNTLVRTMFLLPFKDTQCGAKLFKRQAILTILPELGITEFTFDIDLLLRLHLKEFKIKEVPTIWEHKPGAKFNFTKWFWKLIPIMFLSLCRLRLLHSPFRSVVRAHDVVRSKIKKLFPKF